MARPISTLRVSRVVGGEAHHGFILAGGVRIPCVLGKTGLRTRKREGDGATPRGLYALLYGFYRPDRMRRPACRAFIRPVRPDDGWCDDPTSFLYNRPVRLPATVRSERMMLESNVYDVVFVTSHNMRPRILGAGSAIFLHCARPDGGPTEGCVALRPADLRRLLPRLAKTARLRID